MKYFFSVLVMMALSGCLTSPDPEASYPQSAADDKAYFPALHKVSKHVDVIHNFETKYTVDITHLTGDFRRAMAIRYQEIFHDDGGSLAEAGAKTGFFVSIYTANREMNDFNRKELWNISLTAGGRKVDPTTIQRLTPKERWSPFFPSISLWSQEYLLLFDVPPPSGDAPQGLVLTLSSPDGTVVTEW